MPAGNLSNVYKNYIECLNHQNWPQLEAYVSEDVHYNGKRIGLTNADGTVTVTIGTRTRTGKTWVQGNFLCSAYPKILTGCGAVFRNPSGTRERENEYRSIYHSNSIEFSVVK